MIMKIPLLPDENHLYYTEVCPLPANLDKKIYLKDCRKCEYFRGNVNRKEKVFDCNDPQKYFPPLPES